MRGPEDKETRMTVPASQRKESKLAVLLKVDKLVEHTLTKLENPKKFGTRSQTWWYYREDGSVDHAETFATSHNVLARRLEDTALKVSDCAYRANDIRVETLADYEDRHFLQESAVRECGVLLHLLNHTRKHCSVGGHELAYWCLLAVEARSYLRKWRDSDRKRFSRLSASGMRG